MSFAYSPPQVVATASSVASAPVNQGFSQIGGALNQHVAGSAYAHSIISGAGGVAIGAALQGTAAAATGATDLYTMMDRLANAIGILAVGTSGSGVWTTLGNISGAGSGVNNATAVATLAAIVRRDAVDGGAAFGTLSGKNVIGAASDSAHAGVYARGASGDPVQTIFAVQNNAGSVNRFAVDNAGNTTQAGNATMVNSVASGLIYAGSGVTQVTDSVGLVRVAALPVVDGAHGGMGVDVTVSGNKPTARTLLGAAASGANGDITALTGLTTALGSPYGGTGLVSPAAGSIPVTNGAGNWQLLPPTPANFFVVSNGTTYVAQAFATSMIPSGTLNQSVMSALYPSAGTGAGNLLKAQAQPWQGYINGAWVSFVGGAANYSPPIDPTGIGVGQTRIDLLVLNAAGNLAWIVGTPSATPSIAATATPTQLSVVAPIWYVQVAQGATSITGYSFTGTGAAFIQDARNLFGPTSASSGGGGYLTGHYATMTNETATLPNSTNIAAKPFVTIGADADFSAETDIYGLGSGAISGIGVNGKATAFRIDPSIIRPNDTSATYADGFWQYVSGNTVTAISFFSSTSIGIAASVGNPVTIFFNGEPRTITANLVATYGGAAGQVRLIASRATVGVKAFTISIQPLVGYTLQPTDVVLAQAYWTGSAFLTDSIDFSPIIPPIGSAVWQPQFFTIQGSGSYNITATGTYATIPISGSGTVALSTVVNLPCPMRLFCWLNVIVTQGAGALVGAAAVLIDGTAVGNGATLSTAASSSSNAATPAASNLLAAGAHTISIGAFITTAGTLAAVNPYAMGFLSR